MEKSVTDAQPGNRIDGGGKVVANVQYSSVPLEVPPCNASVTFCTQMFDASTGMKIYKDSSLVIERLKVPSMD